MVCLNTKGESSELQFFSQELLPEEFFAVPDSANMWLLRPCDVILLSTEGNATEVFTREGRKVVVFKSLSYCERRFPSWLFFRANRNQIVNLSYVTKIEPHDQKRLLFTLSDRQQVILSRNQSASFRIQKKL